MGSAVNCDIAPSVVVEILSENVMVTAFFPKSVTNTHEVSGDHDDFFPAIRIATTTTTRTNGDSDLVSRNEFLRTRNTAAQIRFDSTAEIKNVRVRSADQGQALLSADASLDSRDSLLVTWPAQTGLDVGLAIQSEARTNYPATLDALFIFAVADSADVLPETHENRNQVFSVKP